MSQRAFKIYQIYETNNAQKTDHWEPHLGLIKIHAKEVYGIDPRDIMLDHNDTWTGKIPGQETGSVYVEGHLVRNTKVAFAKLINDHTW